MIFQAESDSLIVSNVTLDGIDITSRCFFADDEIGYVAIYKMDEAGHILADDFGNPIRVGKLGKVAVTK